MSGLVAEAMWSVDALAGSRTGAPLSSSGCLSASLGSNSGHALSAIEEEFRRRIHMFKGPDDSVPGVNSCLMAVLQSVDTVHLSSNLTVRLTTLN